MFILFDRINKVVRDGKFIKLLRGFIGERCIKVKLVISRLFVEG